MGSSKMKKCVYVIDSLSRDNFHEVINQGCLMMLSSIYEKVVYIADKSVCDNIMNSLQKNQVRLNNVFFEPQNLKDLKSKSSISAFFIAVKVGYLNNKYYRLTPHDVDVFFLNFLHFTALFNHLLPILNKNRAFYLCHAEMEFIESAKKRGCFAMAFRWYLILLFRFLTINEKSKFILLSDGMAETFRHLIPQKNRKRIFGMDHCYVRPEMEGEPPKLFFSGLKIGIPGAVSPTRGIRNLQNLVPMIKNSNVRIYAIGTLSSDISGETFVKLNKTGCRMSFDWYEGYVKQMDAYLMVYDLGSYRMTASGALLEAVWNEKPIFALRNAYFDYMFKKFGPLGELADSVEELADIINSLTVDYVNRFKPNVIRTKNLLLPCNVKKQLERIINS